MTTLTRIINIEIVWCCVCGGPIAFEENQLRATREKPTNFYCNRGHVQGFYGNSYKEKLANAERDAAAERARHDQTKAALAEAEKKRDRLARRLKAGVCPCCKRTFKQLARHMEHKHPGYAKPEPAP